MRILFSTVSAPHYMAPPILSDEQINCGPFFEDRVIDGRVVSLATPRGEYDLSVIASRLPADQRPDLVVCLVDSSWFNVPCNFTAFKCPKIALIADTHHMAQPILGMINYLRMQKFDRNILLYTRHHLELFRAAGVPNLHWLPGLTFPHNDAMVRAARREERIDRIALIGQSSGLHQRRLVLAGALAGAGLPLVFREGTQRESLGFYGSSLIGFNATANADLNLRAFEITAAGSLLLMDRLAPESGVASLWQEGREYVGYGNAAELVERARYFIAHPEEARAIGGAAARWFDRQLNAPRRRQLFERIVVDGHEDPMFALPAPSKFVLSPFGGRPPRYVAALAVYEHLQKLHSTAEVVRVQVDDTVPADFARLGATLPRLQVRKQFSPDESPDCYVTSTTRALALQTLDAPRIWCWDATPAQILQLAVPFKAAGLVSLREDVAYFGLPAADAGQPVEKRAAEARMRLQQCDSAGALDTARHALQENPRSVDAYLVIAEIALEAGKRDLFAKMIAKSKELSPDDPRALLLDLGSRQEGSRQRPAERMVTAAVRHLSGADLPKVKAVAARALAVDPHLAAAWHWSGRISLQLARKLAGAMRQQEHAAGLDGLRRAVELAPHRADFCHELGLALWQAGRLADAISAFERATVADPLDPALWCSLGEVLLEAGESHRAMAVFERGLEHAPADSNLLRGLDRARNPQNRPVAVETTALAAREEEMLPAALDSIVTILNTTGIHPHEVGMRLAAEFAEITRQAPAGLRLPARRTLMANQAWFGLDMQRLTTECLERGHLLVLFDERTQLWWRSPDGIDAGNFRTLEYRGINLWRVCRYQSALLLRKMTEQIDPALAEDQTVLGNLYSFGAALVDKALAYFDCYRPDTVVIAQGHDLMSAVIRHLAILSGLRVISLENIFRKDRLLWEDVSGISVNQNLSRNYYWRHRDFVSDEIARQSVDTYREQLKSAKSGEHASPLTPLPEGPVSALPTITYLAQVSADSSVLFGLRGFESQVEVIAALAAYVASRRLRLLVKLHPKENPTFKGAPTTVRGLTSQGLAAHPRFAALRAQLGERLVIDESNRFDTYDLIRRAQVCVTINSQAGLEAAIHGREVVLCGDAFYGSLGFTHEVTDSPSLEFVLDRILRDGLRVNHGPASRAFFHIFTELYCLPKTVESVMRLLSGRPVVAAEPVARSEPIHTESMATAEAVLATSLSTP
jgi:tetratricopeptide (TPR) repeat protein